jgi:hypothetical protein
MKAKILLSLLSTFVFYLLSSQVPQGFNYQAIARDGTGSVLVSQLLPVRITIQTSLTGGTKIWEETHSVTTNQFGIMTFVIGDGIRTGGSATLFSDINWSAQILYLKTEMQYPGPDYTDMGTTQLWSVPYSLVAKNLGGPVDKLGVKGTTSNMEEALFEVKNKGGQTVFAVYNEGVRIYVDDGDAKGAKGGFAIGGFGMAKAGDEYLRVTKDSTRIYINDLPGKSAKGGFAIGGFNSTKGYYNYLKIDESKFKGGKVDFLNLTSLNTFIGEFAGKKTIPSGGLGSYNSFIGYQSGTSNTSGTGNVFLGYQSGMNNTEGEYNVFIGNQAGYTNTGVGSYIGDYNVFIGYLSGYQNTDGQSNVFVGKQAGFKNTKGRYNTFLGQNTGGQNLEGNFNTYLGAQAAEFKTGGSNNTIIGNAAGSSNTDGSGNVFIGSEAGFSEGGSNKLYIENSNTTTPLIGGDFSADKVGINGLPDPASATFQVFGDSRLGYNGTSIDAVIKATVIVDLPAIAAGTSWIQTFTISNVLPGGSVNISPGTALGDGLDISYARVSASGTVEVKFRNNSSGSIDPSIMVWYITVIQ